MMGREEEHELVEHFKRRAYAMEENDITGSKMLLIERNYWNLDEEVELVNFWEVDEDWVHDG